MDFLDLQLMIALYADRWPIKRLHHNSSIDQRAILHMRKWSTWTSDKNRRRVGVAVTIMALFRALGLNHPLKPYEPKPRFDHYAGAVGGQCFVFAGRTVDFDKTKEELSSTVEVFDQYLEEWKALNTTDNPPKGLYAGGYCVSPSGDLYVYGGFDGSQWRI